MRQETNAAPAVRDVRILPLLAVLAVLGCRGSSAAPRPDDDAGNKSFVGVYELRAVDGTALPTAVRVGLAGATMQVATGALTFGSAREILLKATGPLGSAPNATSLSTGGVYVRFGADSLRTTTGVEGRVSGDTAEIRTASWTVLGSHEWRYVRVPSS